MHIFLIFIILFLAALILYQHFVFRTDMKKKLREMGEKLKEINDTGSSGKVFVFTDSPELTELAAQINRLLEEHLKTRWFCCYAQPGYRLIGQRPMLGAFVPHT